MYCQSCGREIGDAKYCPVCGTAQDDALRKLEQRYGSDSQSGYDAESMYDLGGSNVADAYRVVFREPLALVITILMTVAALFSLIGNQIVNIHAAGIGLNLAAVFPILIAVGLWLTWAQPRKTGPEFSGTGLAIVSGTVKALFIVNWVAVGIMAVCGIVVAVAGQTIVRYLPNFMDDFLPDIMEEFDGIMGASYRYNLGQKYAPQISGAVIAGLVILLIVLIAVMIVFNICFFRKLHRFTKSVCVSLKNDVMNIECVKPVKSWLIVYAVFAFIGAAASLPGGVLTFIGYVCQGLAAIFASTLIKRHFGDFIY